MKVKEERNTQIVEYDSASDEESGFGSQELTRDSDDDYSEDAKKTEDVDTELSEGVSNLCITSRGKDTKQKWQQRKCSPYSPQVSTRNSFLQTGGTVLRPNFEPHYDGQTTQNFEPNIPTTVQNYKQPQNFQNFNIPPNIAQNAYNHYPAQNIAQYNILPQNLPQNNYQNQYHSNIFAQNVLRENLSEQNILSENLSAQNGAKAPEYNTVQFSYSPNIPVEDCPKNSACSHFLSDSNNLNFNIGAQENGTDACGALNGEYFFSDSKIENFAQNDEILNVSAQKEDSNIYSREFIEGFFKQETQNATNFDTFASNLLNFLDPLQDLPVLEDNVLEKEVPENLPTITITSSEYYRDMRQSFSTESSVSNIGSPESYNNWASSPRSINSPYSSCSTDSSNIPSSTSSSPVWNPTYLDKVNIPTVIKDISPQKTAKQKMQDIADKKPLVKRLFWDDYSLKYPQEFMEEKNGLNLVQEIIKNEKKDLLIKVFAVVTNLLKYCQPTQVDQVFNKEPHVLDLAKSRGIPLLYDYLSEIVSENSKKIKIDKRNI